MFLALRNKLAIFESYVNPFNRRGALRLSRYHPRAYLFLTVLAALGGYLFVFLAPLLLLTMPVTLYLSAPAATTPLQYFAVAVQFTLLLIGLAGTVAIAGIRFPLPTGMELDQDRFPRLFELLEELAGIFGEPRIDQVLLRDRFDVRIVKTPRNGFSVGTRRTLIIGLPVLLTLSPIDVHALIARRIGQLAGHQHRLTSWLYHLRDLWPQYTYRYGGKFDWMLRPLRSFFRWYAPRFRSLALGAARWDELNADLCALQAISDRDAVKAISSYAMVDDYLTRVFWPGIVKTAGTSVKPEAMPHARMAELFQNGLGSQEMNALFKRVATARSNPKSILPSLSERLDNMGHSKPLPLERLSVSAARFYLGGAYDQCIALVDKRAREKVRARVIKRATSR